MNTTNPFAEQTRTPIGAKQPVIKAIGLGGAGQNAINRMIELGIQGIEFISANTDAQALKTSKAPLKIQLGPRITRGLGAGGNPEIGEAAAEESYTTLTAALTGADMVFLTAGMGGGTGTGSIPVVARAARATGAVVVAIVSTPFSFEIGRRQQNAREGLSKLRLHTDTLITVPNDRLLQGSAINLPLDLAFRMADDVLRQGIQGITELITMPGIINVDFSHIKAMMMRGGGALLAMGLGEGQNKAYKAVERALHHPMLDDIPIENATGIIANFSGGTDLAFFEVAEALSYLQQKTHSQAEIIPGLTCDERMGNHAQVILIITGLGATSVDQVSAVPHRETVEPPIPVVFGTPVQRQRAEPSALEMAAAQTDLDLPAFLRRRGR